MIRCLLLFWLGALVASGARAQEFQELPTPRPAARPRALVELEAKRDSQREQIEKQSLQRFAQLRKDYDAALGRLQDAYQSKGSLEGVLATRAERQRLQRGGGPAHARSGETPPALRSLQQAYQQAQDRILREQQSKVDDLLRAYVASLRDLQKALTTRGDLDGALAVRAEAQQYSDLAVAAAPTAPRPEPAARTRPTGGKGLQLRPQWDQHLKDPTCARDAAAVFSRFCRAEMDLDPAPDIELMKDIPYLTPLARALRVLGKPAAIRRPVGCTAFPRDSFFYHSVEKRHSDGFSLMLLITDQANQVVGVELIDEAPQRPPTRHSHNNDGREPRVVIEQGDLRVYDFIRSGAKASGQMCIRHFVTHQGRVLQIDTELIGWRSDTRWRPPNESPCSADWWNESDFRCKERVRLILAEPVAALVLQYLKQ